MRRSRACPPASSRRRRSNPHPASPRTSRVRPGTAAEGPRSRRARSSSAKPGVLMQIVEGRPSRSPSGDGNGGAGDQPKAAKISAPCCRSATRCARCCAPRRPTGPWRRGPGQAARRLLDLHPLLRADQPHRHHRRDRPRDRRGARDAPAAESRAVRRRPGLLAGRQHRGLRPRKRPRPHGPDVPRTRHRAAGGAADHHRRRRARRHAERDRPRRSRPSGRTPRARSGGRASPNSAPPCSAIRAPSSGRPPTPICPAPVRAKLAVAEAAAALDPQYARNVAALREVQPQDIRPSDITARLGAPWIPTDVIEAFAARSWAPKSGSGTPRTRHLERGAARTSSARPRAPPNGAPRAATPANCCTTR